MSRNERQASTGGRRRKARTSKNIAGRRGSRRRIAVWGSAAVLAVAAGLFAARDASASHPEPRPDAHSRHVAAAERYSEFPRVAGIYATAAEVKGVLDGIFCYCLCREHSGHYSLLDCFKDDHAARCDVCLSEAALAHKMNGEGASLDQIRAAVDGFYAN